MPDGTSLANRTYYSPYGEIRNLLLPPPTERGWLGKTKDPTTGLNALGARYYDATLGRFLSTDPASDGSSAQAANAYSYAANNPITYMDPTGLWSLSGAWNAVKSGVSKAADWVDENKGLLTNIAVGIGVGIAVGALCATGVGCVVAAGVAAGAAGAAACYGVDVAEGKKDFSWGGLATEVGIGAASGVAGVGVGKVIGTAGRLAGTAARKAVTRAVNRTGTAVANAVRSPGARAAAVGAKVPAGGAKVANAAKSVKSLGSRGRPAPDTGRLTARADQLADALDPIARNHRTAAAMSTTQGRDVLAGGVRDLNPAQRALAGADDVLAKAPGEHAEVTAMLKAADEGLTPSAIGTSRDICPACQTALQNAGAQITGPRTAVWPR